jgi:hypothetical protein
MDPSDVADEIEVICGAYDGCVELTSSLELMVTLPHRFLMRVVLPAHGYPYDTHCALPVIAIVDAKNAVLSSLLERSLVPRFEREVVRGAPMLMPLIQMAIEEADTIAEDAELERLSKVNAVLREEALLEAEAEVRFASGIDILAGTPIVDRKSKFLAHVAKVSSVAEVEDVVRELRSHRAIACAAHPAIYAYRFADPRSGVLHQDADDDGETGASKKMLFLLDQLNVRGYVVVVTRWFGGILLGPDRFKHIMGVVKSTLEQYSIIP